MISRVEKEDALINKFRLETSKKIKGYEKKVRTQVNAALDEEYDIIILGKAPKPVKKVKEDKKSYDFGKE